MNSSHPSPGHEYDYFAPKWPKLYLKLKLGAQTQAHVG